MARFVWALPRADAALVFASDDLSLAEKGAMCMLACLARRGVVLRLSSGRLPEQCDRRPALRWLLRLTLRSAHIVCAQGPYWRAFFESFPEAAGKIREIPNGISMPLRSRCVLAGSPLRLIFVGWVQREKGVFELVEAVRNLKAAGERVRLTIVGGGRDDAELRETVRTLHLDDVVSFSGWIERSEVARLLDRSDVFVLPTHFEGLPNAMLEAMAAGLAVVATPVGSIPDVVTNDVTGRLVAVGDVTALTKTLADLAHDPPVVQELGTRGRALVRSRHDIGVIWPKYLDALRKAIGTDRTARVDVAATVKEG
jgi:glycosyltransferase involved in cell wall biosynthesis